MPKTKKKYPKNKSFLARFTTLQLIILYILIPYGLFYVLLPHEIHMRFSPDWLLGLNFSHIIHISIGAVMIFIAFIMILRKSE